MKKKVLSILLVVIVLFSSAVPVFASQPIKIIVDGKEVQTDTSPFIKDNRTMVPVRFVSEALGAKVSYYSEMKDTGNFYGYEYVYIVSQDDTDLGLNLFINKLVALSGEAVYRMDTPSVIKDNRTFVPLRFIADYFRCSTTWNGDSRTITITSNAGSEEKFDDYYDDNASEKLSNWLQNQTKKNFEKIFS